MGKYASTRGVQRYTRDLRGSNATVTNNKLSEWLYGDWSKEKLREYELYRQVPVLSQYMDYLLDIRADEEYLRRYGMDYSNIHDPRRLRQSRSGFSGLGSVISVSSNVASLYK